MADIRYQTSIKWLYLPLRIQNRLTQWGILYIEQLMGTDPFMPVQPIGPDDYWVAPHTLPSGTYLEFYQHTLSGDRNAYHFRWSKDPWIDMRGIGFQSCIQILEAIEWWREGNRNARDCDGEEIEAAVVGGVRRHPDDRSWSVGRRTSHRRHGVAKARTGDQA